MTPWVAKVLTLFPEAFPGVLASSVLGKALDKGVWSCEAIDIRDFATDNHKTVDDTPFGGGAGMVLKPDVVDKALKHASKDLPKGVRKVYLSPRGRLFDQEMARDFSDGPGVLLLSGRYEGIDQRVIEGWDLEEVSIGDYILTGGEVAAQVVIEASARLLKGVVGKEDSLRNESFELELLEHSHYTRPQVWKDMSVPEVLLSGNHGEIDDWRRQEAEEITRKRRPDLWVKYQQILEKKK